MAKKSTKKEEVKKEPIQIKTTPLVEVIIDHSKPVEYKCPNCKSVLRYIKFGEYECLNTACLHKYSGFPPANYKGD